MRTAWKSTLLPIVVALAACDHPPTTVPTVPPVRGAPTQAATDGVHRRGNVVVASGADADTIVRHLAARWADQGNRILQSYLDTSRFWNRPPAAPAASVEPLEPPDEGSPYADMSSLHAAVGAQQTEVTVNASRGLVANSAAYVGTDAHTDLAFGANYAGGATDVPAQSGGANDGHAMQKAACGSEVLAGSLMVPDCLVWAGTVKATAQLSLSHDCGEYVYGSATTTAWFELPVPNFSISTNGVVMSMTWKKFGSSGPVAGGRHAAYQAACPTIIEKTPTCGSQLIYDPSGCDPSSDGTIQDPTAGTDEQGCTLYLVQVEISYDGGKTWIVIKSWLQTLC
jgi:hypothetical protein